MDKKRVLITGASSNLMQKLIKKLDKSLFEIIGVSRYPKEDNSINWVIGDITNLSFLTKTCKNIDVVIHAAAITHSHNEDLYYNVNFEATKKLLDVAKKNNIEKFIFISTRTAVPKSGGYGLSKLKAEDYIKQNFGNWLIFKLAEIFGGNKNEGIDSLIEDTLTKKALFYPMQVESKLYPIHINDAVDIMFSKLNCENETIIINGNNGFNYKELIKVVAHLADKDILMIPIPKFIMYGYKLGVKMLNLNGPICPDQITRLYCEKPVNKEKIENKCSLESYIKKRTK